MDLLAIREHSRGELRRKLQQREVAAEDIDVTLDALEGEGLLSDARFAASFVTYRAGRGQGPVRIRHELELRGVCSSLAEDALTGHPWQETARAARIKKFGTESPEGFKERARQARFLQYRGFTSEQVRHALGDIEALD